MEEKKLISFILLTYRSFDGVLDTLKSVYEQDYPRIEIIFGDDGSPNYDEEMPAIRTWAEANRPLNIERIVYNHLPENRGTITNANAAYALARGTYIKDLGADDTLASPDALSRYVDFLEKSGCLICFSKMRGVTEDGKIIPHLASSIDDYAEVRDLTPLQLRDRLFARDFLPAPAWFAKKELFERHGYYLPVTRLIEDYPYWIHLCNEGVRIAFMDDVLINYRLSGESGGGRYGKMFMKDMFAIYEQCIFPLDRRYGLLQPVYNSLKRAGLNAYMDHACWEEYNVWQKISAWLRHGIFYAYINYGNYRVKKKNEKDQSSER